MKRVLACLVVVAVCAAESEAQEDRASLSVDVAASTYYAWRGIPLTAGPVIQSGYTLAAKGLSVGNWQNLDVDDTNGASGATSENDWALTYEFEAGKAKLSAGLLYYTFPGTVYEPTTELVVGASFDVPASPSVSLFQDLDDAEGLYAAVGLGHGFKLGALTEQTLDLGLTIGYGSGKHNEFYYSRGGVTVEEAGLTDLLLTVSTTFKLNESAGVTPALSYASVVHPDVVDAFDASGTDTSKVILAATFSFSF